MRAWGGCEDQVKEKNKYFIGRVVSVDKVRMCPRECVCVARRRVKVELTENFKELKFGVGNVVGAFKRML